MPAIAFMDCNVTFDGQVRLFDKTMFPTLMLPMVKRLAVIRLSSAWDRPSVVFVSVPLPRFTPAPSVWISTFPADVAFTLPVSCTVLAVSVIRPPLE